MNWLVRISWVSSRRLLPAVVEFSISAFLPSFSQMPSAPFFQPSPVISSSTFFRSRVYFLNGSLYHCLLAGVMKAWIGLMSGWTGPKSVFTTASRSVA